MFEMYIFTSGLQHYLRHWLHDGLQFSQRLSSASYGVVANNTVGTV